MADLYCPDCGSPGLVRGPDSLNWRFQRQHVIRCLSCGARLSGTRAAWLTLPRPALGDAFETGEDRDWLVRTTPMTLGQGIVVVSVLLGGLALAIGLSWGDDAGWMENLGFALVAVAIYPAWRIGRWLFPPTAARHRSSGDDPADSS